jgi:hypothetical protein
MKMDPSAQFIEQVKEQFEALDRTTRTSLDRLRSVIYRNKKELEGPIFQNKSRLDKIRKRSTWVGGVVLLQMGILIWLVVTNVELKKQVDLLNRAATDLEVNTVKSLQKMESEVIHIQKARDAEQRR